MREIWCFLSADFRIGAYQLHFQPPLFCLTLLNFIWSQFLQLKVQKNNSALSHLTVARKKVIAKSSVKKGL